MSGNAFLIPRVCAGPFPIPRPRGWLPPKTENAKGLGGEPYTVHEVRGQTDTRGIGNTLNEPRWTEMSKPLFELV